MIKFKYYPYRSIIIFVLALLRRTVGALCMQLFYVCTCLPEMMSGKNNSNKRTALNWPERGITPLVKIRN